MTAGKMVSLARAARALGVHEKNETRARRRAKAIIAELQERTGYELMSAREVDGQKRYVVDLDALRRAAPERFAALRRKRKPAVDRDEVREALDARFEAYEREQHRLRLDNEQIAAAVGTLRREVDALKNAQGFSQIRDAIKSLGRR